MDIDTIDTDDFMRSKKSLVSLSVAILSVWVLDVQIHQLSIWGLDIQQQGEGFLYILIFLVLLYVFGNFLIRQKTLNQRWRNEDLALGGIEHQFKLALNNIEGYGIVLDRLNLIHTNVDRIDCIRHVLEKLQSDPHMDLDKMNEFMTRTSVVKIYDDYEDTNLERVYEIVDELAKNIDMAKREVSEKYEDLSGIKFWNGTSYRVLDLFAPRVFAILAFVVCLERIIVLNGIWDFAEGLIWG